MNDVLSRGRGRQERKPCLTLSCLASCVEGTEKPGRRADLSPVIAPITALIFLSQKLCGLLVQSFRVSPNHCYNTHTHSAGSQFGAGAFLSCSLDKLQLHQLILVFPASTGDPGCAFDVTSLYGHSQLGICPACGQQQTANLWTFGSSEGKVQLKTHEAELNSIACRGH